MIPNKITTTGKMTNTSSVQLRMWTKKLCQRQQPPKLYFVLFCAYIEKQ